MYRYVDLGFVKFLSVEECEAVEQLCEKAFGTHKVPLISFMKFDPTDARHISHYFDWESLIDSEGTPDYFAFVALGVEGSTLYDGTPIWFRRTEDGFKLMYTETDLYVSRPEIEGARLFDLSCYMVRTYCSPAIFEEPVPPRESLF